MLKFNNLFTYENPIIAFLANSNVILVNNNEEFDFLAEILLSFGLDLKENNRFKTLDDWTRHKNSYALIEYTNHKGFTFSYEGNKKKDIKTSIEWYGYEPITIDDIKKIITVVPSLAGEIKIVVDSDDGSEPVLFDSFYFENEEICNKAYNYLKEHSDELCIPEDFYDVMNNFRDEMKINFYTSNDDFERPNKIYSVTYTF